MLFQCVSKRRHFLWSGKITYEEAFQNLLKSYLPFAGSLENLMQRKVEATERRDSMVKCRKMPFGGKGLVKIPWDSTCMRVIWKLLNTFGWILKNYRNTLPLNRVDQLVWSAKNEILFYLSKPGIRHILNGIIL